MHGEDFDLFVVMLKMGDLRRYVDRLRKTEKSYPFTNDKRMTLTSKVT
jgi:hypothetical protein